MKTKYVPRVNQLDAITLDDEIQLIFKEQLSKPLQTLWPKLMSYYQPEIDLLLKSILWKYSIYFSNSSFGQQLLSITYDKDQITKQKLVLHYILSIVTKYLKDNATLRMTGNLQIQKVTTFCENFLSCFYIFNFFRFLKSGKRPSIVDYILGLDHITMYGNKRRNVGYTHMTRELLWGGFMELLGFTVPLINYHSLSRRIQYFFNSHSESSESSLIVMNLNTTCAFCQERPVIPYHIGCGHIYCYYCLKGNLLADEKFQCFICNKGVIKFEALVYK